MHRRVTSLCGLRQPAAAAITASSSALAFRWTGRVPSTSAYTAVRRQSSAPSGSGDNNSNNSDVSEHRSQQQHDNSSAVATSPPQKAGVVNLHDPTSMFKSNERDPSYDWTEGGTAAPNSRNPDKNGVFNRLMQRHMNNVMADAKAKGKEPPSSFKDAVQIGRQVHHSAMTQADEARASAAKHMSIMKPAEKLRAVALGRYDPSSHFLMMDLDFQKDSVIFGTTREEFYENVERMKQVIVEYHRWERNDNFYLYGTRLCQVMCCFFVYDSWEQERYKNLLAGSLDNYRAVHEEELEALQLRRLEALDRAVLELETRPPNFDELLKEQAALSRSTLEEDKARFKSHPMDTMHREKPKHDATVERRRTLVEHALNPASVPAVRNLRKVLMPQTTDWAVTVREEMLEYKQAKASGSVAVPADDVPLARGRLQQVVAPIMLDAPRREPKPATA